MDKHEAQALVEKQAAFLKKNGHFAGLAPGVNGAFLRRAKRILDGSEIENKPVVAQVFDDHGRAIGHGAEAVQGPLLPEVAVAKAKAAAVAPEPVAPAAEPEPEPEQEPKPEPVAAEPEAKPKTRRSR